MQDYKGSLNRLIWQYGVKAPKSDGPEMDSTPASERLISHTR